MRFIFLLGTPARAHSEEHTSQTHREGRGGVRLLLEVRQARGEHVGPRERGGVAALREHVAAARHQLQHAPHMLHQRRRSAL